MTELRAEPRVNASIRRINRDRRFNADKSPCKCRMHLIFWQGEKPMTSPGLHLVIQTGRVGAGAGHWMFGKPELARYQTALQDEGVLANLMAAPLWPAPCRARCWLTRH